MFSLTPAQVEAMMAQLDAMKAEIQAMVKRHTAQLEDIKSVLERLL